MSQERLIWRPNSIPLSEWEKMPREEQIRWWKSRQEPYRKPDMKRALKSYQKGSITLHEFPTYVCLFADKAEIAEFFEICPAELVDALKKKLNQLPADDDDIGWSKIVWLGSACYAPWVTKEEIQESDRQRDQDFRVGVKLLRAHLRKETR
jgi:hypothetical protein